MDNSAFEKARQAYGMGTYDDRTLEFLFPQLRESEDERIRKALIDSVRQIRCKNDITQEQMLAYLEKQKEQKPSAEDVLTKAGLKPYKDGNQWCILAGDNIQEGICGFGDTIEDALYEFLQDVLNIQKEQKPAEWSEADKQYFCDLIAVFKKSLEDNRCYFTSYDVDRLKSCLERPTFQSKQEWSEADKNTFRCLHDLISYAYAEKFINAQMAHDTRAWINEHFKES